MSAILYRTAEVFETESCPPSEPLVEGLIHTQDLISLGARRRNGKTTFLMNLAVAGATESSFIGYSIPKPFKSLLFMLEDNKASLQAKLKKMRNGQDLQGHICFVTRDDFFEAHIRVDSDNVDFRNAVKSHADQHGPDFIVLDNLSMIVSGNYNDPEKIHRFMELVYSLATRHNAAVAIAAHPKKFDLKSGIVLEQDAELFVEQIMGSSNFINQTGSVWALEKRESHSVFLGGRQRGDGHWGQSAIYLDENDHFQIYDDSRVQFEKIVNTPVRQDAWNLLSAVKTPFSFTEAYERVRPVMRSKGSFQPWFKDLVRVGLLKTADEGRFVVAYEGKRAVA